MKEKKKMIERPKIAFKFLPGLRGAMVARLTPDQKAACSSHVGVTYTFLFLLFFTIAFFLLIQNWAEIFTYFSAYIPIFLTNL